MGTIIPLGAGARQMVASFTVAHPPEISLSPAALPVNTLRTVLRMLAALIRARPCGVIEWGGYVELFSYDDETRMFSLDHSAQ